MNPAEQIKVGVYVCHCGSNIAGVVDVPGLVRFAEGLPGVALAREYKYMCSDPGQDLLKKDIAERGLNRVVVVACSPLLHERTFRRAAEEAGLNPFLVQMANVREHVAWVSLDPVLATRKARAQMAAAVARVREQVPLETRYVPVTARALVVGGGIAGIQAALTLAAAGKDVVLVEREPTIGGHMAKFDKTFPTLDCAACILTPKMTAVKAHPGIKLLTYSEVERVDGSVGNYRVRVRRKARYIDEALCVGCMECIEDCIMTARWGNAFDQGLGRRKPIYLPFPQAVPPVPVIDRDSCVEFKSGRCKKTCIETCGDRGAINLKQEDWTEEYEVGAIVLATGFQTFDPSVLGYLGYGVYPNVYTSLEVERLLNAAGPSAGKVTLRDGQAPRSVAIVHCVGSRDAKHHAYCSRVCCMYSLKLAQLVREKTGAEVTSVYIDMRAAGKGFEEFYERVQRDGVSFVRGRVGDVTSTEGDGKPGRLVLRLEDTLLGGIRELTVDMLILSVALEPDAEAGAVRRLFGISASRDGFFLEKHPKLAPVNTATDGVMVAGACQGPKDIPDTVAQADAAAGQALALIDATRIALEPNTAEIDAEVCSGCRTCISLCPYTAIHRDAERAAIDQALCKGCGTCVAACPSGAASQHMFTDVQLYREIEGVLSHA